MFLTGPLGLILIGTVCGSGFPPEDGPTGLRGSILLGIERA
ncbi:hypothetical protein OROGR_030229 [Orobanche gracilis]